FHNPPVKLPFFHVVYMKLGERLALVSLSALVSSMPETPYFPFLRNRQCKGLGSRCSCSPCRICHISRGLGRLSPNRQIAYISFSHTRGNYASFLFSLVRT